MLITPAKTAGVKRVVATAPVMHGTGNINAKTLVAMDLAEQMRSMPWEEHRPLPLFPTEQKKFAL